MKCPNCNSQVSSKDVTGKSTMTQAEYRCNNCGKILTHTASTAYFIFFILIGAPIIEAILHWFLGSLFYPVFGATEIFEIEVIRVVSATTTLIVLIGIFLQVNKLKEKPIDQTGAD